MKNKVVVPTILFALLIVISFFVFSRGKSQDQSQAGMPAQEGVNKIIFFYGDGCPHCEVVEKYFKENNTKEKVAFVEKEVYRNKQNSKELTEKAVICGLPTDSIGVPFLWDGEKCMIGDEDIINFFEQKINK